MEVKEYYPSPYRWGFETGWVSFPESEQVSEKAGTDPVPGPCHCSRPQTQPPIALYTLLTDYLLLVSLSTFALRFYFGEDKIDLWIAAVKASSCCQWSCSYTAIDTIILRCIMWLAEQPWPRCRASLDLPGLISRGTTLLEPDYTVGFTNHPGSESSSTTSAHYWEAVLYWFCCLQSI